MAVIFALHRHTVLHQLVLEDLKEHNFCSFRFHCIIILRFLACRIAYVSARAPFFSKLNLFCLTTSSFLSNYDSTGTIEKSSKWIEQVSNTCNESSLELQHLMYIEVCFFSAYFQLEDLALCSGVGFDPLCCRRMLFIIVLTASFEPFLTLNCTIYKDSNKQKDQHRLYKRQSCQSEMLLHSLNSSLQR